MHSHSSSSVGIPSRRRASLTSTAPPVDCRHPPVAEVDRPVHAEGAGQLHHLLHPALGRAHPEVPHELAGQALVGTRGVELVPVTSVELLHHDAPPVPLHVIEEGVRVIRFQVHPQQPLRPVAIHAFAPSRHPGHLRRQPPVEVDTRRVAEGASQHNQVPQGFLAVQQEGVSLAQFLHLEHGPACLVGAVDGLLQAPPVSVRGDPGGLGDGRAGFFHLFRQAGQTMLVFFVRNLQQKVWDIFLQGDGLKRKGGGFAEVADGTDHQRGGQKAFEVAPQDDAVEGAGIAGEAAFLRLIQEARSQFHRGRRG